MFLKLMDKSNEREWREDRRKCLPSRKFTALWVISCSHKAFKPREKVLRMLRGASTARVGRDLPELRQ